MEDKLLKTIEEKIEEIDRKLLLSDKWERWSKFYYLGVWVMMVVCFIGIYLDNRYLYAAALFLQWCSLLLQLYCSNKSLKAFR